ncbi:hypothetical protein [Pseudobacteroides cellulosolvens]|uniref:Uncharacterized protein n=1 Tax=Pseudobacteroides cellulosolvens ATCC 35603 = DSM 2933 TaxID=398512 RepID=A0A0L6JL91_9FIRM|nr:hypothetical protein [Pseudobacteroides cellulosolvens]KNY26539.1 hypothetical protein Bccel_1804 [Pseudobacteroides cellulosolvens ATCC 35603 = DSM 2933]
MMAVRLEIYSIGLPFCLFFSRNPLFDIMGNDLSIIVKDYQMEDIIYNIIEKQTKKVIDICEILNDAEKRYGSEVFDLKGGYGFFSSVIKKFCDIGIITPVKSSGSNGRNPSLHNKYKILSGKEVSFSNELMHELQSLHPKLDKGTITEIPNAIRRIDVIY